MINGLTRLFRRSVKKTNLFFIRVLFIIALLSFSGTSSAYDLPEWASKPVQWVKHVAQWFGYEGKDEQRPAEARTVSDEEASETPVNKEQSSAVLVSGENSGETGSGIYNLETINFSDEIPDYGIRFSGPFNNTNIDLYASYGEINHPQAMTDNPGQLSISAIEKGTPNYIPGNGNVAARLSHHLPFLSILHQGTAPSVNIESSYRFDSSNPSYASNGLQKITDYNWKTGVSYKGKNLINLPVSPVGINWGIGYDYNSISDNYALEKGYKPHKYHSGNIFAGSYWHNLKLYTMFMYHYDSQLNSGMTTFSATYSPSLKWSYGISANFYNSSKDINAKETDNPEQVSFTATYRWD
jgi:hypothetical protein